MKFMEGDGKEFFLSPINVWKKKIKQKIFFKEFLNQLILREEFSLKNLLQIYF